MTYALHMLFTRRVSNARQTPTRATRVYLAALVVSAASLALPVGTDSTPVKAAGTFDVSAWAPWWQATSALNSYSAHAGAFGELSPFFFSAGADGNIATNTVGSFQVSAYKTAAAKAGKPLIPTVVDATAAHVMAGILADPTARADHIQKLVAFVVNNNFDGVDLDYEQFAFADGRASWADTRPLWGEFISGLAAALHAGTSPRLLEVSVPPIYNNLQDATSGYWVYDYPMLAANVDRIRVMTYSYSTGSPGGIAPIEWVDRSIQAAIDATGTPGKIVMGIPLYGTDWVTKSEGSCPRSVPSDMKLNKKSYQTSEFPALAQRKGVVPLWDKDLAERTFTYVDSIGGLNFDNFSVRCNVSHTVYYVDPDGVYARIKLAKVKGIAGVSFWALGNDDNPTWAAVDAAMMPDVSNPGYPTLEPNVVALLPAILSPLPARLVDTRPRMTTLDGEYAGIGFLKTDSMLTVKIAGRGGVVPTNATAVALNITAIGLDNGYITVYPCGERPTASSLNVHYGQIISNSVITKLSADGSVCIYSQFPTHLVVDVFNILSPSTFAPVSTPARLLDTRPGGPTADGKWSGIGAMTPGLTLEVPVGGRANMTNSGQPAVLNVTVDGATESGYLTIWPCGTEQPKTSNLNYVRGATFANAVVTKLSTTGSVCIFSSGTTHVIIDAFGEMSTVKYVPLAQPARLLDTRAGNPTLDGQFSGGGVRSANTTLALTVGGRAGLSDQPAAVVLNVTVDGPALPGFVTVYPCGGERPNVSNVNYAAGQTLPNLVVTSVSGSGTICVYNSTKTHIIVDVFGELSP